MSLQIALRVTVKTAEGTQFDGKMQEFSRSELMVRGGQELMAGTVCNVKIIPALLMREQMQSDAILQAQVIAVYPANTFALLRMSVIGINDEAERFLREVLH